MWVCSKLGFFSIVKKRADGHRGNWQIRARVRNDLELLKSAAGISATVQEWPDADYRWRIIVGKRDLARVTAALEASIDYSNFKAMIHATPSQIGKYTAYAAFWGDMNRVQLMNTGQQLAGPESGDPWP